MRFFILLILAIFSLNTQAQKVSTYIDSSKILIGDYLHLKVNTTFPNTTFIQKPNIVDSVIKPFELVEKQKSDTLKIGSDITIIDDYIISCYEPGNQYFPSLAYTYQNQPFYTDSIKIVVESIQLDTTGLPKPIKGPIQIPLTIKEVMSYFIWAILGIVLVLTMLYIYWKYIKKKKIIAEEKPIEPPHIIALRKLKEIDESKLWQNDKIKEYYIGISDTIREYIERRFSINALEQTTDELLVSLKRSKVNVSNRAKIERILTLSDLAKFAKTQPTPIENMESMELSIAFVEDTKLNTTQEEGGNKIELKKKYYATNEYKLKEEAGNSHYLKIIIFTSISLIAIPLVLLGIIYGFNIISAIVALTNYFMMISIAYAFATILIALLIYLRKKKQIEAYRLIFSKDALTTKTKGAKDFTLTNEQIKKIHENTKGQLTIFSDSAAHTMYVSQFIEKRDEVKERLAAIVPIEFN